MPMWNELAETVHAFGSKIFGQVFAGVPGRQILQGPKTKGVSPLPVVRVPRENIPKGELEFEARKGLAPILGYVQ